MPSSQTENPHFETADWRIDTALPRRYCSARPKMACIFPIPGLHPGLFAKAGKTFPELTTSQEKVDHAII